MAITDPAAIKFANERLRPAADRLARVRYRAEILKDSWTPAGADNDARFAFLRDDIERFCNLVTNTFRFIWWADRLWEAQSLHLVYPNDQPDEVLYDGPGGTGPDPNRTTVTVQDLRRLKNRMEEFSNWVTRGTDVDPHWNNDGTATAPATYLYFNAFAKLTGAGGKDVTTGNGRAIAVDRTQQIINEYTIDNAAKFGHILTVGVNTQSGPTFDRLNQELV